MKILKVNDKVMRVIAENQRISAVMATLPLTGEAADTVRQYLEALERGERITRPTPWVNGFGRFMEDVDLPALYRASGEFRQYLVDMVGNLPTMVANHYDTNIDTEKAYLLGDVITAIDTLLRQSAISGMPEVKEAFERIRATLKSDVPEEVSSILMSLLSKARMLVPPYVLSKNPEYVYDIFLCLYQMIPPGTDPLHAMMYLQRKVKTIKDLAGNSTIMTPRPGVYRFWLSKALELHIDFQLDNDSQMRFQSPIRGCTATVSCPGQPSLRVPLEGYHTWNNARALLPLPDNSGPAWSDAFQDNTVTVHVDQWNMDLERDDRS